MNSNKILRAYSIKEVSKKVGIPTGTIRQWEKDLNGLFFIPRTKQGARYFTEKEISLLKKIKEMREQNVSKDMIRSLLQKHFSQDSETPSETLEVSVSNVPDANIVTHTPEFSIADFHQLLEGYKQELTREIKQEIANNRQQIVEDVKNEIATSSLHSIKEISKSIQRANDKRKGELQEISSAIIQSSEYTSESFETLVDHVSKASQGAYERVAKKIAETSKLSTKENNATIRRMAKSISDTKSEIQNIVHTLDEKQEQLLETMNELKQSTEEIQLREEVFQGMLSSYREVAASKAKKKTWWKIWS